MATETTIYDEIRHLKGCPSERTEAYTAERPDGERLGVVRCIDCGQSETVDVERVLELRESLIAAAKGTKQSSGSS